MRNEFSAIESDISNKLPPLAGNGSEVVVVNSGGTALESVPYIGVTQGGTGSATASGARTNIGAAASGTNTDITSIYLNNTGLKVKDTDATHGLSIVPGSNLTADRQLTITTGDAARTIDVSAASLTLSNYGSTLVDDADAATARTTLGLGSVSTQNSNSVSITGGSATGLTNLTTTDFNTTNLSIGGNAVTATAAELNYTDVTAVGVAQATKAVVLDSNKNISGLGKIAVGGSARGWASVSGVVDIGNNTTLYELSANSACILANNVYYDGTNYIYISNGFGTTISISPTDGRLEISTFPSGVAGAIATGDTLLQTPPSGAGCIYPGIFHGRVAANGTAIRLPAGWTSTRTAAGSYSITHNLGNANYTAVASTTTTSFVIACGTFAANTFLTQSWVSSTLAISDCAFSFVLMLD